MERVIEVSNGSRLCIEEFGDPSAPLVLQIEGHMAQLIATPASYCQKVAEAGFRVVRFDNRDVGRSSRFPGVEYTLAEMVDDAHRLIEALTTGSQTAVVCGRSMGGAIAQMLAIHYPNHVAGLGLFYTFAKEAASATTGGDKAEREPAAPPAPIQPTPFTDEASFTQWEHESLPAIAGSAHPYSPDYIEWLASSMWERGVDWDGFERQRRAMGLQGPWADLLRYVHVPTVIVHGEEDPVVPVAAGKRLAKLVPGAELRVIPGLGHQQPPELDDVFIDATLAAAREHR